MLPWSSVKLVQQISFFVLLNTIFTLFRNSDAEYIPMCSPKQDQLAYISYMEEETQVTTYLMDLTTTICPSTIKLNHSQSVKFILFPSSQPYYDYFTIRHSFDPSHPNDLSVPQLLSLKNPIDRESLCSGESSEFRSVGIAGNSVNNLFPGGISSTVKSQSGCSCQTSLEWCSIYVQLALTPYHDTARNDNSKADSSDSTLSILDVFIVEIRIRDVNDNAPTFIPEKFDLRISEVEQVGARFRLPSATDKDIGKNAQFEYRIRSIVASVPVLPSNFNQKRNNVSIKIDNGHFELISNLDRSELFVVVKQSLDREKFESFQLVVEAVDKGATVTNTGTLALTIYIVDANDRSPVFQRTHYVFHISEQASPGTIVGRLSATDDDSGENGRVTFEQPTESIGQMTRRGPAVNRFRVEPVTGQIRVHSPLDREVSKSVYFRVIARDHGQPVRMATASVMIILQDINDNNPVMRIWGRSRLLKSSGLTPNVSILSYSLLSSPGLSHTVGLSVTEALEVNAIVVFVDVYDMDAHENGEVSCLVNHESFALEPITDYGSFSSGPLGPGNPGYSMELITESKSNKIHRGNEAYRVVSTKSLDRETIPLIHVPIVCRDNGTKITRSTTTLLYIQVSDVNDNSPVFNLPEVLEPAVWSNKEQYREWFYQSQRQINTSKLVPRTPMSMEITIPEFYPLNQTVIHFSAHDADDGINALLSYDLTLSQTRGNVESANQNKLVDFLTVKPNTGDVFVQVPLWYAGASICHEYIIRATDHGQPALSASIHFSTCVVFINKMAPKLEIHPVPGHIYTKKETDETTSIRLWLAEHQNPGTAIGRAIALDEDHGEAGRVKFFLGQCLQRMVNNSWIVGPNPFAINEISGLITNVRIVDRELDANQYRITVVARDQGTPPKTSNADVIVYIIDRNDHSPQFQFPFQPCYLSQIRTPPSGRRDLSAFETVTKSLSSQTVVCNLTQAFPELYSMPAILPDHPLTIDALQPLVEFSAVDPDEGVNGKVEYQMTAGCLDDFDDQMDYQEMQSRIERTFSIDQTSGCLKLLRVIHYGEIGNKYALQILAKDGGTEISLSTALDLWIAVEGQPNSYLELRLNSTVRSVHCLTHASMLLKEANESGSHELTPTIRVLMSVTTVIGALIIVTIMVLFIKQPAWFFGLRQSRRRVARKKPQLNKMDIFQCHEGKLTHRLNYIAELGLQQTFRHLKV